MKRNADFDNYMISEREPMPRFEKCLSLSICFLVYVSVVYPKSSYKDIVQRCLWYLGCVMRHLSDERVTKQVTKKRSLLIILLNTPESDNKKDMFTYSAASSPLDRSKRSTLHPLADLFIPTPPRLLWEAF